MISRYLYLIKVARHKITLPFHSHLLAFTVSAPLENRDSYHGIGSYGVAVLNKEGISGDMLKTKGNVPGSERQASSQNITREYAVEDIYLDSPAMETTSYP